MPNERPTLDAMIRTAVFNSDGPADPDSIAERVVARIRESDMPTYLREAVKHRLSSVVGQSRGASTPYIRKGISSKQSIIRDEFWPAFLRQQISLPTGYKALADATADDLRFVAQTRRAQANELVKRADQFDTLAQLMDKSKAKTLSQLDSSSGESVLQQAA
jgi:hypothetical protein